MSSSLQDKNGVRERAEARFKRAEVKAIEGAEAKAEHDARAKAVDDNTVRLRTQRLARDAVDAELREVKASADEKARRRKVLTGEPAVVGKARVKKAES